MIRRTARLSLPQQETPHLARAQLRSLARRLPLLYVILFANASAMAATADRAPLWLRAILPGLLVAIGALRTVQWSKLDVVALDDGTVARRLRVSTSFVIGVSMAFTLWSFALLPYLVSEERRAAIASLLTITIIGTMFCLVHLRFAAPLLVALVIAPSIATLLLTGRFASRVVALDFLVVAAVMTINATGYYRAFRKLNQALKDLAELLAANERAAGVDSLTGIGNRRLFFAALDEAVATTPPAGFAVGLIDLDGFKLVNDLHGHAVGDELLAALAARLAETLPPHAVCARLGGDEFAFLVPGMADAEAAHGLGRDLCAAIGAPVATSAAQLRVAASLGLAICPTMGDTRQQLIEHADFALYHAKAENRGSPVLFCAEHAAKVRAERRLRHALRAADFERELSVVFQPIIDVVANRVTSFEALARWASPTLGRVSPADFIPVVERLGLMEAMTEVLFHKSCAVARLWPDSIRLSFNLSGADLARDGAARRLCSMVAAAPVAPGRLIFEVTETAVIQDFSKASACLTALRDLGCRVALDDFGTGFSSLSYVHRLPLDELKIDRSFVQSLAEDRASRSIVQSIIDLTAKLGISCVVEGVETQLQADTLRAMGCGAMQGWLFGTPISEAAMLRGDFPLAAFARVPRPRRDLAS